MTWKRCRSRRWYREYGGLVKCSRQQGHGGPHHCIIAPGKRKLWARRVAKVKVVTPKKFMKLTVEV